MWLFGNCLVGKKSPPTHIFQGKKRGKSEGEKVEAKWMDRKKGGKRHPEDTPPPSFQVLKTRDRQDLPLDTGHRGRALCPPPPEWQDPGFLQTTPHEVAASHRILPPHTWKNISLQSALPARARTTQDPRKAGLLLRPGDGNLPWMWGTQVTLAY